MKLIVITALILGASWSLARAQEQELRWGEFGYYSNWERFPYAIKSEYKFIGKLPDLREFPLLLTAALDPKMDRSDREIIISQMRTLSRCDFEKRILRKEDDVAAEHRAAVAKWEDWWTRYGSKLAQSLDQSGDRNVAAWKQVAPSPYLECPKYPISIPGSWSSTISFGSGDYGGVTQEVIEFHVRDTQCELRRQYRTGWMGKEDWTYEVWKDLSQEEAAHFLASLIYAIDNPWFFGDDEISEVEDKDAEIKIGTILGRPKEWTDYYPGYDWTGILDVDQRVIINHDPHNWNTFDHKLGGTRDLDEGFGVVFRLVRDLFPDPSWDPDSSRWKKVSGKPKQKAGDIE